ncbi:MAG: hypothetical protein AB9869_24410 [Verrucomicrobiia bacterium]
MKPFLPLGTRPAGPLLFVLAVGGLIALGEYWMRCQLPQKTTKHRRRTTPSKVRRAAAVG